MFPLVPIMEDVVFWDRLKQTGEPILFLKPHVTVSARRYVAQGVVRRILLAARVLFLYRVRGHTLESLRQTYEGK